MFLEGIDSQYGDQQQEPKACHNLVHCLPWIIPAVLWGDAGYKASNGSSTLKDWIEDNSEWKIKELNVLESEDQ